MRVVLADEMASNPLVFSYFLRMLKGGRAWVVRTGGKGPLQVEREVLFSS